ncbi:MAG: dihydroorotase [Deltaproteobacteria bacterium]|nr:dihydroorotase [Deltaproteobacteria bacterium]MBW2069835.1 dihydroorotase [Deltaproteobacteria bacterium]
MKLLLKNGTIIDPSQNMHQQGDLLLLDGKIAALGAAAARAAEGVADLQTIEVTGKAVVPGLIDMHTHLREPGFEYKETIRTGSEAAVAGGFTSVACMPNTDPVNDNRSVTEFILQQARQCGLANVYPVAALSKASEGRTLTEFADLRDAGAVAFSDDGNPVIRSAVMRRALEYAYSLGMPVISHCEDRGLAADGVMHEGLVATRLGLRGMPSIAEDVMVARDIAIAEYTNTAVHIAHVSTRGAVQLIRDAKDRGVQVTAEATPHHFTLTDEALAEFDTNAKVNPPLRAMEDVEAIQQGLKDGTIEVIASDHAPHSPLEKEVEFDYAAFGMVGLETAFSLSLRLVLDKVLTLDQLVQKMSCNPARILNLAKGTLAVGSDADVTVFDLESEWTVTASRLRSKSKNTPFDGWTIPGRVLYTIVGGEIKYQASES